MTANSPWQLFIHYLRPHYAGLLLLWFTLFATIATQLFNPQIIARFLNAAQAGSALGVLLGAAGIFLAIALLEQLLGLVTTYLGTNIGWQATNQLREDVVAHCLTLDREFHKTHSPGELLERIDGDINALGNLFSQLALNLLNNLLLLTGVLVMLWWIDWRIGLVLTLVAITGLVTVEWLRRQATPHWEVARQADAELYGFLEERLHGTEDIRANGAVAYTLHRLLAQLQRSYTAFLRIRPYNVGGLMVPILIFGVAYAAVFLLGDWLYQTEGITVGTVYLVVHYLGLLSGPLWEIVNEIQDLQTAGASVARVQGLLQIERQIQDTRQGDTRQGDTRHESGGMSTAAGIDNSPFTVHHLQFPSLNAGPIALEFDNVSVRYTDADVFVLHNITFTLPAGETLGLLGRTGSGKTTLTRLLLRLVDPTTGAIKLGRDGVEIRQLVLRDLRSHVGIVTQEVQLFHATVRDNLTFFDETVTDERLWSIAEELRLADWLRALPAGLDTMLGAGGQGLSAGQAQLVAFLRIGLQDPGLVILDEPSSRLDPLTERLLDRAIERLLTGRTCIIIAHRLETVAWVDQILVLAEGRMVELGKRAALMAEKGSHYAGLLAAESQSTSPTGNVTASNHGDTDNEQSS